MQVSVENVVRTFGTTPALYGVSLDIKPGELVALLGPSGSGKTTLLRILAGLDFPTEGRVLFDGEDALKLTVQERNVGLVFQNYALFRNMTVIDNIGFGLSVRPHARRPSNKEIKRRALELLDFVQLSGLEKRYPSQLSGGQRQRVAFARALAIEPRVLLLDEPFGALDAKVRRDLRRWLREVHDKTGHTTVFVTHDQEEALEVADEIVVINDGRIEQIGTPDQLYDEPANDFVMRFLGPVTQLGRDLIRPHDIELHSSDPGGAVGGEVTRIVRVGFEVRAEVTTPDQVVLATLTRTQFLGLGLEQGSRAWVRPVHDAPTVPVVGAATPEPVLAPH
jgi:sulfate transport system ATP-binding protein